MQGKTLNFAAQGQLFLDKAANVAEWTGIKLSLNQLRALGELTPEMVDMRTLVIIGSSQTRRFPRAEGGAWVYTPRWYPD